MSPQARSPKEGKALSLITSKPPLEKSVTSKVMKFLKDRAASLKGGAFVLKVSHRFAGGIPDIYYLETDPSDPRVTTSFWIELKRPGKEPTKLQYATLKELKNAGAVAMWCDHVDAVKRVVADKDFAAIDPKTFRVNPR